ncbi:MAG: recombinase family protein [Candidatus Schekmanbacteria bacterium]|nr:recombinase family protein [Candidatus Schekmanbacteria bacterium]
MLINKVMIEIPPAHLGLKAVVSNEPPRRGLASARRLTILYDHASDAILSGMRLVDWAEQQGITYQAAWRLSKAGCLSVPSTQLKTRTILVHPPESRQHDGTIALFARVSSAGQQTDLERQLGRLTEHASHRGFTLVRIEQEMFCLWPYLGRIATVAA